MSSGKKITMSISGSSSMSVKESSSSSSTSSSVKQSASSSSTSRASSKMESSQSSSMKAVSSESSSSYNSKGANMVQQGIDSNLALAPGTQTYYHATSEAASSSFQMLNDNGKISTAEAEAGFKMIDDNGEVSESQYASSTQSGDLALDQDKKEMIGSRVQTEELVAAKARNIKKQSSVKASSEERKIDLEKPLVTSAILLNVEAGQITDFNKGNLCFEIFK